MLYNIIMNILTDLLSTASSYLYQFDDLGLLALRIAIGTIFLVHGKNKFGMWKTKTGEPAGPMSSIMRFLAVVEPLGGLALLVGFLTPFASIGLALIMIGAMYFKMTKWHTGMVSQNGTGWELDLVILAGCIALMTLGAGAWSLDMWMLSY